MPNHLPTEEVVHGATVLLQMSIDSGHTHFKLRRGPYVGTESTCSQLPRHEQTLSRQHNLLCQHYHVFLRCRTLHQTYYHHTVCQSIQSMLRLSDLTHQCQPLLLHHQQMTRHFADQHEIDDCQSNFKTLWSTTSDSNTNILRDNTATFYVSLRFYLY